MSPELSSVAATSCGKINLFFEVGALRADGYHDVASLYQAVALCETVRVSAASDWRVSVTGNLTPAQLAAVPTDASNLVVRAAQLLAGSRVEGELPKLHFEIDKQVPVAGGMGGGSADAAAALVAAARFWNLDIDVAALQAIAAELGADVPFALLGGAAVGSGSGETLVAIAAAELHWVLITDNEGLSTPSVYRELDRLRLASGIDPSTAVAPAVPGVLISALGRGDVTAVAAEMRNDLQTAALGLRPELAERIALAEAHGALRAIVSGSGPTVAALVESSAAATELSIKLQALGLSAIATRSAEVTLNGVSS